MSDLAAWTLAVGDTREKTIEVQQGAEHNPGGDNAWDGGGRGRGPRQQFEMSRAFELARQLLSRCGLRLVGLYLLFVLLVAAIVIPAAWGMSETEVGMEQRQVKTEPIESTCGPPIFESGYPPSQQEIADYPEFPRQHCPGWEVKMYPLGGALVLLALVILFAGRWYRGLALRQLNKNGVQTDSAEWLRPGQWLRGFGTLFALGAVKWLVVAGVVALDVEMGEVIPTDAELEWGPTETIVDFLTEHFSSGDWVMIVVVGVMMVMLSVVISFIEIDAVLCENGSIKDAITRVFATIFEGRNWLYTVGLGMGAAVLFFVVAAGSIGGASYIFESARLGFYAAVIGGLAGVGLVASPVVTVIGYAWYRCMRECEE